MNSYVKPKTPLAAIEGKIGVVSEGVFANPAVQP